MKQDTVKLPRRIFDEVLEALRRIRDLEPDKSQGESYPHALGRCNGIATGAVINLEVYGKYDSQETAANARLIAAAQRAAARDARNKERQC